MQSVAGIAIRNNKIFAAKRRLGGSIGGKWEFPGGKLEAGESEEEAVIREYYEEFGLMVQPIKRLGQTSFYNGQRQYKLAAYHIQFSGEPKFLLEHEQTAWFDLLDLRHIDLSDSDRTLLGFITDLLES